MTPPLQAPETPTSSTAGEEGSDEETERSAEGQKEIVRKTHKKKKKKRKKHSSGKSTTSTSNEDKNAALETKSETPQSPVMIEEQGEKRKKSNRKRTKSPMDVVNTQTPLLDTPSLSSQSSDKPKKRKKKPKSSRSVLSSDGEVEEREAMSKPSARRPQAHSTEAAEERTRTTASSASASPNRRRRDGNGLQRHLSVPGAHAVSGSGRGGESHRRRRRRQSAGSSSSFEENYYFGESSSDELRPPPLVHAVADEPDHLITATLVDEATEEANKNQEDEDWRVQKLQMRLCWVLGTVAVLGTVVVVVVLLLALGVMGSGGSNNNDVSRFGNNAVPTSTAPSISMIPSESPSALPTQSQHPTVLPSAVPTPEIFFGEDIHAYDQVALFVVAWGVYLADCLDTSVREVEMRLTCSGSAEIEFLNHRYGMVTCRKISRGSMACFGPAVGEGEEAIRDYTTLFMVACATSLDEDAVTLTAATFEFHGERCGRDPSIVPALGQTPLGEAVSGVSLGSVCFAPTITTLDTFDTFPSAFNFAWSDGRDEGHCVNGEPTFVDNRRNVNEQLAACVTQGTCERSVEFRCNLVSPLTTSSLTVDEKACFLTKNSGSLEFSWDAATVWNVILAAFPIRAAYASELQLAVSVYSELPPS